MRLVLLYFLTLCATQAHASNIQEDVNFSTENGERYVAFTITTPFEGEKTYTYQSKEILRKYLEIATNNSVLQAFLPDEQADLETQVPMAELFAATYWEKILEHLSGRTFAQTELYEILQNITVMQIVTEIDPKKGHHEDNKTIASKHTEKLKICRQIFTSPTK